MASRRATKTKQAKQQDPEKEALYKSHPLDETDLPWWATFKPTALTLAEMSAFELACVDAYVANPAGGYAAASRKLGASTSRVTKALKKPNVVKYMERRFAEIRASNEITKERVMFGLLVEAERSTTASQSARVKAWELLGKEVGMFVERSESKAEVTAKVETKQAVQVYLPDNQRDPGVSGAPQDGQAPEGKGDDPTDPSAEPN